MNVTQVQQTVNLWALKKIMSVAQSQVQAVLKTPPANLEPYKGTRIDVRL